MLLTKEKVNIKEILIYTVIIIFLIFNFFPVFWMIISSIKPTGLVFATPPKMDL